MRVNRNALAWIAALMAVIHAAPARPQETGRPTTGFATRRHVYERGEAGTLVLRAGEATSVDFDIDGWLPCQETVQDGLAQYTIDTSQLRADDYTVRAHCTAGNGEAVAFTFPITVAKPHDDERIPVWRWGHPEPEWWGKRGFTGGFLSARRDPADADALTQFERFMDDAARHDFELGLYLHPLLSARWENEPDVRSLLPDGTRHAKPYPLEPAVIEHAKATTDSWVAALRDFPAFRHVMLHSEWQQPFCVNQAAVDLCLKETGLNIADFVTEDGGLKGFDASTLSDGLIDDDHPRYRFLQWWWQRGHGTAPLNAILHGVVKAQRPDLLTWHEPYRLAPVRGSHQGLDSIASWTYGYPDIKRLCYTTYLQAAARPEGQLVQQDITLFVYGRYVMALDESSADLSMDQSGGDPFFTAGPDYAREAMWLVLSQRPDLLCFYSAGKLSPDKPQLDPHFTSPETFDAIGQTCERLVEPYGPAIRACERAHPEVALLMSAASTWFSVSGRLPGYPNEQTLPYATLLMMNHVPFVVLLDEDVAEGALERYTTLVMPRADTLTRTMHAKIVDFANAGGTVIADTSLRADIPGAKITDFDMTHQMRIDGKSLAAGNAVTAEEDRAITEGYAATLAPLLAQVSRQADAQSPRVLTNTIEGGAARYHFFINDDRTYGPRFGQWKLCFELGVPQTAKVSIGLDDKPALYDALRRQRITYETVDGRASFEQRLPAARGALIAALPEPIGAIDLVAPEAAEPGEPVTLAITVLGESGKTLDGVLPLRIDVMDPLGRDSEWSRYTCTRDGSREFVFTPALNDAQGEWMVRVTDLVAGKVREAQIHCGT